MADLINSPNAQSNLFMALAESLSYQETIFNLLVKDLSGPEKRHWELSRQKFQIANVRDFESMQLINLDREAQESLSAWEGRTEKQQSELGLDRPEQESNTES